MLRLVWILLCLVACFACQQHKVANSSSILRISAEDETQTWDPRRVRDLPTVTIMHMLYEGLMKYQADGKPVHASSESVEISPDQMRYTFKLRRSAWSNGEPVTAH